MKKGIKKLIKNIKASKKTMDINRRDGLRRDTFYNVDEERAKALLKGYAEYEKYFGGQDDGKEKEAG